MIKAILYDLDGVLVDATEWHYEALNDALKEVAGFIIKRNEHITTFNGIPTMKKLEILCEQGRLNKSMFEEIWEKKQEKTFGVIEKYGFTDSNKIRLHEQTKNLRKVCVTNSIKKSASSTIIHSSGSRFNFLIATLYPSGEGFGDTTSSFEITKSMYCN